MIRGADRKFVLLQYVMESAAAVAFYFIDLPTPKSALRALAEAAAMSNT